MMAQDEIRHAAVIAERRPLAEELLVEPVIAVFEHEVLAIARERPRKAGDRIKVAFGRLHDAESDVIADSLHLRQGIRIRIRDIRAARDTAHLLVLEWLHDVAYGVRIEETVGINKDEQFMLRHMRANSHGLTLALIDRLDIVMQAVFNTVHLLVPVRLFESLDDLFDLID